MPTISVLLSSQNPATELFYVILFEFECPQSVSYCRHKILPLNFLRRFTRIYMPTISVQKISFSIAIPKYTIQVYSCFFYTDIQISWFVSGRVDFLVFQTNKTTSGKPYLICSSSERLDSHLLTLVWRKELFSILGRFEFCWARDDGQSTDQAIFLTIYHCQNRSDLYVVGRTVVLSSVLPLVCTLITASLDFAWREVFA